MATQLELEDALRNAAAAGDEASARRLADELVRVRGEQPTQAARAPVETVRPDPPNPWERFGRGAQNTVDRLSQLWVAGGTKLGKYSPDLGDVLTQQINQERAAYDRGRVKTDDEGKEYVPFDPIELAGQVGTQAPTVAVPGGGAGTLARAGAGAASGALSGFLQYDPTNSLEGTLKNTGTGAGVGAVAGPVLGWIGDKAPALYSALAGRIKGGFTQAKQAIRNFGLTADDAIVRDVPELAQFPDEVRTQLLDDYAAQLKKAGTLDKEGLIRKANLLANNLKPTQSMVTRNPRDWTIERNLQKMAQSPDEQLAAVGQELTDVYQKNNEALTGRLESFGANLPKGTQEALGQNVMKSVDDLARSSQQEVGAVYNQVRQAKGDQLASDARALVSTLDDLQDNAYSEKIVASVRNKLRRFGMLDESGQLTSKTLTVTQAEELRKFVNALPNDFGKKEIIRAIDSDVLSGLGEDAFAPARQAAAARFDKLDNPATQRALNAFGELTQGKTAQNFIKTQIIDGAEQDVNALLQTIGDNQQAKDSLQAGVLQHLEERAINGNSGQFSGAAFNKALDQIGDGKLALIFGPERAKELRSLAQAAVDATYQPPFSAVNNSNTAPLLLSTMQRARSVPGVPLIVTDEAQRLAAQSGYRGQLAKALRAQGSPGLPQIPGSAQRIAQALRQLFNPSAQAALNQQRDPQRR